jgi:prepilin-type processing-associated H-X9-DG protein/prepilin-type N-terminal cleavage/methylation domain-containing protein
MRTKAFTLVELLVVVGIMAVLIGVLLPALHRAQEESRRVTCLSNLRQLAIAAQNYVNASRGSYPIARDGLQSEWDFRVVGATIEPGILWMGQTNIQIHQCPSCSIKSPTVTDPFTGYNYNISYVGHGVGEFNVAPARAARITHGSEVALFGDGEYYGGTDKFMRAPLKDSPLADGDSVSPAIRAAGTQAFRHRGYTNVAFCDGHAESLSLRYTNTSPATFIGAGTGFLSFDNTMYRSH